MSDEITTATARLEAWERAERSLNEEGGGEAAYYDRAAGLREYPPTFLFWARVWYALVCELNETPFEYAKVARMDGQDLEVAMYG